MSGVARTIFLLCVCIVSGVVSSGNNDIYSGYTVYGVKLRDQLEQRALHDLEVQLHLDVWQHGVPGFRDAHLMVSPTDKPAFLDALRHSGITSYVYAEDVAKILDEHNEKLSRWRNSRSGRTFPFEDFPRLAQVDEYIESLAAQYPELVTLVNAGPSYEGRDIKYLKISTTNFSDPSKPVYFMDAMIHAREWVTTPVALYTIHRLVEDLRDEDRDLLEQIDWIILPVVNPDGYEYTHTDVRLWRRTRSFYPEVSETCYGVDANRNFDVEFNTLGVSSNPCSDTYPGPAAFSEIETRYVRDIMFEHLDRIQLYLNVHSYGNYVLFGFGNNSLPGNAATLHHVAAAMGAEIDARKLPEAGYYLVGNSAMVLYATSGSAQDYGQSIGIPFSYTLELPGYGYDFRVPPELIPQINEETWYGIATTARLARAHYRNTNNTSYNNQG